ncbi:kanamycin kinase/aminoglycoside 3'-phosphotransferase-2 [Deinobacterium chartae]|uniref:Kanamycin kinase/aminoglycoside 3'-phosphotransferase-2 n=1 Tax=Deinobacterium chartae TaxID=521158 RepID=A0A841HY05_9DEIO|nr:APH(3') family aminoglycoside O-phosphotransferase [Deinobacterium chartae]MBB6097090.1 kanamycin kinase/aminoglycoside 3'-phosphotransferase-2 [Deinobacterium chartae]
MNTLPVGLPPELRALTGADAWEPVTVGESGATVHRTDTLYLKTVPRAEAPALFGEKERLRWLAGRVPVPRVLYWGSDDERAYLLTSRLIGVDASQAAALRDPPLLCDLLARGLRALHQLPIADCPFDASLRVRLREAQARLEAGLVDEDDFDAARRGRAASDLYRELEATRPTREDLVVTHGDYCLPNIILDGKYVAGFVDVGGLGIADRHQDLALCVRSLKRNIGERWGAVFLEAYGYRPIDAAKIEYYQLLDEFF